MNFISGVLVTILLAGLVGLLGFGWLVQEASIRSQQEEKNPEGSK